MRALLALVALATAALTAPAAAIDRNHRISVASSGVQVHNGFGDHRGGFRRHGSVGDSVVIYDRDYQGDSAWRSDSFNDWWHDNPNRAYPHWMLGNQNCERQWYQGDVLRC